MSKKDKANAAGYSFTSNLASHPVEATSETREPEKLHAVFYTDGGCRPSSRGTAGWGIHGYFYHDVEAKQGTGGGAIPTPMGYDPTLSGKPPITVVEYFDGYGAIPDSTNNYAEVQALIYAFELALEKGVHSITIRADSRYTLDGHASWMYGWLKNNWVGRDGTAPKNVDLWKRVHELQMRLNELEVAVITKHVTAHQGELGNELADRAATCGVISGFNNVLEPVRVSSEAKGYWGSVRDHNRMLAQPYWYFSTQEGAFHRATDGRYIYMTGSHTKEEMETVGKPIADTGLGLVLLKEADPVLEKVRAAFDRLRAGRYQGLVIGDLANTVKPKIYGDLASHGERLLMLDDHHRRVVMGYDDSLIGQEIYPPGLTYRWTSEAEKLFQILDLFVNNDEKIVTRTDITDLLYERAQSGNKAATVKLKASIKSGMRTLDVQAGYLQLDGQLGVVKLTLNMGQDILDRNTLSALADDTTRVHVITWRMSTTAIRYATVIESNGDIGIWAGPYSNLKLMPA